MTPSGLDAAPRRARADDAGRGLRPRRQRPGQGGVSAKEAQALNDAAAMLDDNGQDAVVETNATDDDTPENAQ